MGELELIAFAGLGVPALASLATGVRYAASDSDRRAVMRRGWYIKSTWRRTAIRVGLCQTDHAAKTGSDIPMKAELVRPNDKPRIMVPRITVHRERWGLRIDVRTLGRLGLGEFQAAADYLANAWHVQHVRAEQVRPGLIRLRALLRDPLTETYTYAPDLIEAPDPATWPVGRDPDGQKVTMRSSGVSGAVIAGLAGYGKTSFLNVRFCRLAPSPAVQFVLIDGKGGPDWDELAARAWLFCKDDVQQVHVVLSKCHELMRLRQDSIKALLKVKNMWHIGPSEAWPLLVVIIDEAHTFFNERKGQDKESKEYDALVREVTRLTEELVRKGRNVGIQVLLATQKATGDAIPTRIRDNCQVAVSFAQRTSEGAVAVLGSDIADYPDAHPRVLQHPDYIGVASMVLEGRPGFTLVRTPYCTDEDAERVAGETAHLTTDPLALLKYQLNGLHAVPNDSDQAAA